MKQIKILSITFFLALALFACGEEKPDFLLPEDTMVMVLKDMHIAHAGVDLTVQKVKKRPAKYRDFNRLILDEHHVNRDTFWETYKYYQYHPLMMDSLYVRIIEELNVDLAPLQQRDRPKQKNPIAQ
ncbi:MAG: DUF4296 domain-containing protein [Bacteroidia bacterium]|nr:DUF4296 domain-containing protein [Bacteroidia bacterium]